jgi:hypothetical protein
MVSIGGGEVGLKDVKLRSHNRNGFQRPLVQYVDSCG